MRALGKWPVVVFLLLLLARGAKCYGQNADSLVAGCVRAFGNLSGMRSLYMEQEAKVLLMSIPITLYVEPGRAYYMKTKVPWLGWIIRCARDTTGWVATGKEGKMEVNWMRREEVDSTLGEQLPFVAPMVNIGKMQMAGEKKYDGESCWVVKPAKEGDETTRMYISKATGLLRGVVSGGKARVTFSDYRNVQDLKFPHRIVSKAGMLRVDLRIVKMLVNAPRDAKLFEVPK